jgi:hypothetical protein
MAEQSGPYSRSGYSANPGYGGGGGYSAPSYNQAPNSGGYSAPSYGQPNYSSQSYGGGGAQDAYGYGQSPYGSVGPDNYQVRVVIGFVFVLLCKLALLFPSASLSRWSRQIPFPTNRLWNCSV